MSEQRCGTCKWWTPKPIQLTTRESYSQKMAGQAGSCEWPIPILADSVVHHRIWIKRSKAGTNCGTYEAQP